MLLIGQFEHTIDAKGRLAVPAEIRARWVAERDGGAWFANRCKRGKLAGRSGRGSRAHRFAGRSSAEK